MPEQYELKAWLIALGKNVDNEEWNEITKKYTGGNLLFTLNNNMIFYDHCSTNMSLTICSMTNVI